MVRIKSQAQIKENYKASTGRVSEPYKAGVNAASGVIEAGVKGEALYAAKVQEAISEGRRAKGLSKLTDADWKTATITKGAPIIATRMAAAADKQAAHYEPYRSALESVSLPDRVADPLANVDNRVKPIVKAMVDTKRGQF